MFNPQRKSKVADIYMQQKIYQLHLQKMSNITFSENSSKQRYEQQNQQQRYLSQLKRFKRQSSNRRSDQVKHQNHRLLERLVQTDHRKQVNPESKKSKKHFHSYFSMKRQDQRIKNDNYTMIVRMLNRNADIPSLRQMKNEYRQSRKLAKNCRKLPSIMRIQSQFKEKLASPQLSTPHSSRIKHRQSRASKLSSNRSKKSKTSKMSLRMLQKSYEKLQNFDKTSQMEQYLLQKA